MKRFFKIAGISVLGLLIFLLLLVTGVWFFPDLLINDELLHFAQGKLKNHGVVMNAKDSRLSAESHSFWRKGVRLDFEDLCVTYRQNEAPLCFAELKLNAEVSLKHFRLYGIKIIRLRAISQVLALNLTPEKPPEKAPPAKSSGFSFPWFNTEIESVYVLIPKITVKQDKESYQGNLKVDNHSGEFRMDARVESTLKTAFKKAAITVFGPELHKLGDVLVPHQGLVTAELPARRNIRIELHGKTVTADEDNLDADAEMKDPTTQLRVHLGLRREKRDVHVAVRGTAQQSALPAPVHIKECDLRAKLPEGESTLPVESADLKCGFEMRTKDFKSYQNYLAALPGVIDATLIGQLRKNSLAADDLVGSLRFEIGPVLGGFAQGKVGANYDLHVGSQNDGELAPVQLDALLKITDFKKMAAFLNSVKILVPSPINVLRGGVELNIKGTVDPSPLSGDLDLSLKTGLVSHDQDLDLTAAGKLHFDPCVAPAKNTQINIELVTQKMKLRLPNLDYQNPPAVLPDSRFVVGKPKVAATGCQVSYNLSVKNDAASPILISSQFFGKPVPLEIETKVSDAKPTTGHVKINNYSTTLFRRSGTVEHFDLDLKNKLIDGRVRVDYSEYKIFLIVSGSTQAIHLDMESDPPMAKDQVLAILLFGKPLGGLSDDESGSVQNFQAAAADGALSLASLYLFASTPIESVGYNPHTNGLTAKIKLASGTSLNVGANSQGLTDVGVTKRLSKHLQVETTVRDPTDDTERGALTVLEWFNRF